MQDFRAFRPFKIPVSTAQAYKQFGNSVPVNVVEAISSEMINYLGLLNKNQMLPNYLSISSNKKSLIINKKAS